MSDIEIQIPQEEMNCCCLLCKMKKVVLQKNYIPWISLVRIFYLSLMSLYPYKTFFSVKSDIPDFIKTHWSILSQLSQFNGKSRWRKSMLDAINHSRFFQSGKDEYHVSGYWRLKDTSIPFVENWENESTKSEITTTNSIETTIDSFEIQHTYSFNQIAQIQTNELLKNYYIKTIQQAQNNNQYLVSIYSQVNSIFQLHVQKEIKMNEQLIQRNTEALYKITDNKEYNYSSACLMIKTVF
ncbi:hypothetical protein EHI8A_021100 [Entamoeba histolytica HM-1:IMSS-B]|uniref:Uncharacterized protein n=6 Tax=Entamoeba histolytica TaxID=5759 RepID=C4M465_ENTH1|nr:hypothetical protein EHI_140160 [Entamoeba histolytica HM-1:IMSS]EMD48303.1 Hypothetical protein EHI5A_045280 [Entamoeba histolytica KU27]EMH77301.1 hypothetical protein EHI8A_021100 [Entamoeba histolytica HM-1:IMSS-B]EMS16893.1 hypothetical protein KM1_052950 [Entamoeba histolytica HM-3:IMSS]ENY64414.1 hypothetical protein EHI7A_023460 [Entamoeba histolytica HM-1:IMSS-A]GAT96144.1 hypothetical protein CL6EHI_140160 [Entamoeba histolytica]|eukprot:XP_656742.1 hypothetical protein EHI_140160 [Entamoeba histolytica HM-1:IMSS]